MTGKVTVTTRVDSSPDEAFEAFTKEIDTWWRRGPRYRGAEASIVRFENEHLVEVTGEGSEHVARVIAWEPGERLVLEWLGAHIAASGRTEVEIRFHPDGSGTRVTVEHRGWIGLSAGDARSSSVGLWWGDLLATYRYRLAHAA